MKSVAAQAQQGFTLVELITAFLSSGLALTMGGLGLVSLISHNQRASSEIVTQKEGMYALDFMASETRQARAIADASTPSAVFTTQTGAIPGPKTSVIALEIDTLPEPIIYFLADASGLWQGKALYRWGPPFDANGEYVNVPATSWDPALLIDQISERMPSTDCHGWTKIPSGNEGFNMCLEPGGKIAEFVLHSNATNQELRAKAFARSTPAP